MLKGYLVGTVIVISGDDSGKEIIETPKPEVPNGYVIEPSWQEGTSAISQVWTLKPVEGTEQEAALKLSKLQFMSLPDGAAYEFRALADDWISGQSYYGPNDPTGMPQSRIKRRGKLYKCLQTHVSQDDWTPENAPSLWAEILPGQDGNEPESGYAEWVQPGSTNGYDKGDKVLHNGHLWESKVNNNTWEPGGVGVYDNIWKDLGEYPA